MSERDQDPEDDSIERESAVSLPERDAMSLIRGPGTISPLPPDVAPRKGPAHIATRASAQLRDRTTASASRRVGLLKLFRTIP